MLAVVLATIGVLVAVYEWVAVHTRKLPTITDLVKAAGWPVRILVVVVGALALLDHFITGVIL